MAHRVSQAQFQGEILGLLEHFHRGASRPVFSAEIERRFGLAGAAVRDVVRELRRQGHPIGTCAKGYYYCVTRQEIDSLITDLRGRATSMLNTVAQMEKCLARPEYQQATLF